MNYIEVNWLLKSTKEMDYVVLVHDGLGFRTVIGDVRSPKVEGKRKKKSGEQWFSKVYRRFDEDIIGAHTTKEEAMAYVEKLAGVNTNVGEIVEVTPSAEEKAEVAVEE